MSFRLGIAYRGVPGGIRVEVDGELDAYTVRLLLRALADCADDGHERLELDLTEVGFLDSVAALALVEAADPGRVRGLTVVGASSPVLGVLRVADPAGRLAVPADDDAPVGSVDLAALDD